MDNTEKPKCIKCNKSLVKIGTGRENGKCHIDWNARKYHKKCWKKIQEEKTLLRWMDDYKKYNSPIVKHLI